MSAAVFYFCATESQKISVKTPFIRFALAMAVCISATMGFTAELPATAPAPPDPQKPSTAQQELQALITKIQTKYGKLGPGPKTEKDFAEEVKEFDTLLTQHKAEKTDDVAQILFMKAMLYVQVLDNADRAVTLFKQVKTDFPGTRFGNGVDPIIANIEQMETMKKNEAALIIGSSFPSFDETDITGKQMTLSKYRGKVLLVDFWATWCGPCLMELPYVLSTYEKYHGQGFEIVGISGDKDLATLANFVKTKNMPWQQFFDVGASNKLAIRYGAMTIPTTYLLDREGKIIAKSLRGEQLEQAVADALGKK